jgi:hypothetical protein
MKDAQKPDHISLNTLIGRIREGRFVIPDFQREFEWKASDIRQLMRSIFLDYYIGSLLLWKGKKENFEALSCEPIYGFDGSGSPEHIVLDGQQRLTALHYVFFLPNKNLPGRRSRFVFFIHVDKLMADKDDEAFGHDVIWKRWTKILGSRKLQFNLHIFPFSVLGGGRFDFPNWVQDYERHWRERATICNQQGNRNGASDANLHAENARQFGQMIAEVVDQYQISFNELNEELPIDKVCDIFTQINSQGVKLDVFDLVNALLKPKGLQLKHMWRDAAKRLAFVESEKMNVYILQVMSILRQAYCSPKYLYYLLPGQEKIIRNPDGTRGKETLIASIKEFEDQWDRAVTALETTINVLRHPQEYGAISSSYFPYISILPCFAALRTHIETLPANCQLDAQRKLRHWYWASVFNSRYSGSVESTAARDFQDLKAWMDDDIAEPALIREFAERFRRLELRDEAKKGTSVYNGVFNLLVIQGARDWMTGNIPQYGDLDDHHIVPDSWGTKHIKGDLIHSILNRTPLTAGTNRHVIAHRLPNEYLPELIKANGENTVRSILESHFVSPAALEILLRRPFGPDDFEAFISERQRTIQTAIENLLIKERLDLPPQLRELDEKVEVIELKLRSLILNRIKDPSDVPAHVLQKVDERIGRALKKNAAMDAEKYSELEGKLEYFDLREIQDTVTNKMLWKLFQADFGNTETLAKKFDQLAELRNGIRHSRAVSEITRKEGEAAILWFEELLHKKQIR